MIGGPLPLARWLVVASGLALLAACSSSSGGGSSPAAPTVYVVPQGALCPNNQLPPCE